jgi:tRNA modification GTPase
VLEIIHAENRHQLDAALTQLAGGIARPLTQLRSCLLDLLADLEAGLDFVEEDISFLAPNELAAQLATARETVQEAMRQLAQRQTASYRPRVVLAGWPNVGKSSLFNWLTGGNAIVSPLPGTTRDYLHGIWQFETQPKWSVDLVDTAGFEPITSNALSTSATLASRSERLTADLEIFCLDASREINHWECQELQFNPPQPRLIVWTKADLAPQSPARPGDQIAVSSHSGTGLAELSAAASKLLREATATRPTALYSGAIRSSASLQAAANALAEASRFQDAGAGEELVAAEVRHALESIGLAVGAVYTDDLLDRIFSRFCIGK